MIIKTNGLDNVPDYLNENFFHAVAKNQLGKKDFQIESIDFSMGSEGGDNYCSTIYRVIIKFTVNSEYVKCLHVIVKSMPAEGELQMLNEIQVYEKETDMYMKILPKLQQLLGLKFAPECYYAIRDPIKTIVFQDLCQLRYRLGMRQEGLDEEHCALLLKKLGSLHASSMYLADQDPSLISKYASGLFNKTTLTNFKTISNMLMENLKATITVAKEWQGYEKIVEKLKNLQDDFIQMFSENAAPSLNELKVLNHGDLWVNNFLFKYNTEFSNHPTDVIFIDFQGSFYSSPGIDLNYFLNSSVKIDVLKERRQYILKEYYYKSFRRTLEGLEFRHIPTFDDILAEVRRKELYGFCTAILVLPLISMDKESSKDNNFDNFANEEISKQKSLIACSAARYQEMMKYLLKRNDELGLLD